MVDGVLVQCVSFICRSLLAFLLSVCTYVCVVMASIVCLWLCVGCS